MTPYYPSDKYYEKLCYLCICCCDKNKESYQSKSSHEHDQAGQDAIDSTVVKSSIGVSLDTDIALKTKLDTIPADQGYNNNTEKHLATLQEDKAKEITPAPADTHVDADDANL
eukprot:300198_1